MNNNSSKNNSSFLYFALIAINTFFGLQFLITFISLLTNFLRERPTISLAMVALYALVTFIMVFFAGFLFKIFNKRALLLVLIVTLGIIRIIIQLSSWAPLSLAASALGTVLWITCLIFFISLIRQNTIELLPTFFPAFFAGFAVATGLNGIFGTWDIIWRDNAFLSLFIGIIIAVQVWLTVKIYFISDKDKTYTDGRKNVFYTLIAVMPFVFLQFFRFQNIAALSATAGFSTVISMTIIIVSNIAALGLIYIFKNKAGGGGLWAEFSLTIAGILLLLLAFWPQTTGIIYVLQVFIGNIAAWWLLYILLRRAATSDASDKISGKIPWKNTSAMGISGILFFIFAFIYYGSYDMKLPLGSWMIPVITAILIGICALVVAVIEISVQGKSKSKVNSPESIRSNVNLKLFPIYLIIATLIFPLAAALPAKNNPQINVKRDSIRVMDYNIHQGFNINGFLDLEGIARVIESSGADIVCLEEASRGWVINGSADTYEWLASRLGMKYKLFTPASDQVWGNAILSKYPLKIIDSGFLPRLEAPLRRSFLLAEVNLESQGGNIENINILCTHVHHIREEGFIREQQVQFLLDQWNGLGRTVMVGDFNAHPDKPEIKLIYDAGLIDSQAYLGKDDQWTWIFYKPYERIDYIWVTPDLEVSNFAVPYSTASDHQPIVVDIK